MSDDKTYPEGLDALTQRAGLRRVPLSMAEGEDLPPLDLDLKALRTELTVPEPLTSDSEFAKKARALQVEFEGQPQLCWLNGFVIANLRKTEHPAHAVDLFQKIWAEQSEFLLRRLPLRWLVSSITTFGDKGVNEAQRSLGRSLTILFGMIKLYEFERLYTGKDPGDPHSTDHKRNVSLPLDIPAYSLKGGGLDVALLSRLWAESNSDPVMAPLAKHLLNAINDEPRSLFRRLQIMSGERKQALKEANNNPVPVPAAHIKRNPAKITWAVMATVNDNLDHAVSFAAHHVDLGADHVVLYGEDPDKLPRELAEHPKISVILADDQVLPAEKRERMSNRNGRKAFYFNRVRRKLAVDWLAMLDTDEYLVADRPMREILADAPEAAAFLTLPVVEKFAGSQDAYRPPSSTWSLPLDDQRRLFPSFHGYVPEMMLGTAKPRLFVRAKLRDIRVGNFLIKYNQRPATNGATPDGLVVAHDHADSHADFLSAMPRRLDQGYALRGKGTFDLRTTLKAIKDDGKDPDFKAFFEEVATARDPVISALESTGDLKRIDLDLPGKVDRLIKDIAQILSNAAQANLEASS